MSEKKQTYTIKGAAAYLGVSEDTIRRLIKRNLMRRSLALRKILIPAEDVENFVANTS
jgi:excisionase family DNA binding protein